MNSSFDLLCDVGPSDWPVCPNLNPKQPFYDVFTHAYGNDWTSLWPHQVQVSDGAECLVCILYSCLLVCILFFCFVYDPSCPFSVDRGGPSRARSHKNAFREKDFWDQIGLVRLTLNLAYIFHHEIYLFVCTRLMHLAISLLLCICWASVTLWSSLVQRSTYSE